MTIVANPNHGVLMRSLLLLAIALLPIAPVSAQVAGAWRAMSAPWHPGSSVNGSFQLTYDSLRGECVLVQSFGSGTWVSTWDGTRWRGTPAGAPVLRQPIGAAHDPVRDRLVVVDYNGAVWEWDRTTWTPRGTTPFGYRQLDLCYEPARQRIVTVHDSGIWDWNGVAWTQVPGSATGYTFPFAGGVQVAIDRQRGVLVAGGTSSNAGDVTLEWSGTSWRSVRTGVVRTMDFVDAPALGGIVGYRVDDSDTFRWDPTNGRWVQPGFGGTPALRAFVALAYDDARGRLVAFVPDATSPTWEYDPSAIPVPHTWTVDVAGGADFDSVSRAMQAASPGDRIVVRAGDYHNEGLLIDEGVRIDCDAGVRMPDVIDFYELPAWQPASIRGAQLAEVRITACAARVALADCTVTHSLYASSGTGAVAVERCQLTSPGFDGNSVITPVWVSGPLTMRLDDCTVTGGNGFWLDPFTYIEPSTAVGVGDPAVLLITNSTLHAGDGLRQILGFPGMPALRSFSTRPALVLGGTQLIAGISPNSGPGPAASGPLVATQDTVWTGTGSPTQWIANLSHIDVPGAIARGALLTISATVQPGDAVFLCFAPSEAELPLAGFRIPLLLDPATLAPVAALTPSASTFSLTVPNVPELAGAVAHWQGLAVSATRTELTNARSVLLR